MLPRNSLFFPPILTCKPVMEDGHSTISLSLTRLRHTNIRSRFAPLMMAIAAMILATQVGCQPGRTSTNSSSLGFGNNGQSRGIFGSNNRTQQAGFAQSGFGQSGFTQGGFGQGYANNGAPTGGFQGGTPQVNGLNNQQYSQLAGEVSTLNQRLGAYDADNQLLNTEVAGLKQKLELANQYNQALKQQLADTSGRIKQTDFDRQSATQQIAMLQGQVEELNRRNDQQLQQQQRFAQNQNGFNSPNNQNGISGQFAGFNNDRNNNSGSQTQLPGSATIRANNSLMRRLQDIQIPGGQARMDGDVIRVEFPTDRLFVPGTYQIQPAQLPVLQDIASTIRQSFPRQIIGIEAHWDGTPLSPPGTTDHQLTATQSLATFDELIKLGLPRNQLFTMAMASNRPRHPQGNVSGVSPNRRIELVIYPESYDGT